MIRFLAVLVGVILSTAHAGPIVVLATGQSNSITARPFVWTPNPSAQIWNNLPQVDGSVGTAYGALDGTNMVVNWRVASALADLNPGSSVCLINVGFSNMTIDHWLPGASAPDVYANISANIAAALASCGASAIDYFSWWQGEADANAMTATYQTKFAAVMARFATESWWSANTKVIIFGIPPSSISGVSYSDTIVADLAAQAATDSDHRTFAPSGVFPVSPYWDTSTPGHMFGVGYDAVGALAVQLTTDTSFHMTPYNVTVGCGSGGNPTAYTASGKYVFLPSRLVAFTATAGITTNGSCAGHLNISLPFPAMSGGYFSSSGFDANSGAVLSSAIGAADPLNVHVFTATAGYPAGSAPTITGIYQRQ